MKYKLKETDSNLENVLSILDYIHLGWCELYWIMCRAVIPHTVYAKSRRGWRVVEKLVDSLFHKTGKVNTFTITRVYHCDINEGCARAHLPSTQLRGTLMPCFAFLI